LIRSRIVDYFRRQAVTPPSASASAKTPPGFSIRSASGSGPPLQALRQLPHDLGEVYELIYEFIRRGGQMPRAGRWIQGATQA
jgi:hypothetical protein